MGRLYTTDDGKSILRSTTCSIYVRDETISSITLMWRLFIYLHSSPVKYCTIYVTSFTSSCDIIPHSLKSTYQSPLRRLFFWNVTLFLLLCLVRWISNPPTLGLQWSLSLLDLVPRVPS